MLSTGTPKAKPKTVSLAEALQSLHSLLSEKDRAIQYQTEQAKKYETALNQAEIR